ncbi:MAG: hypothetical protein WCY25_05045 [Moheibacter sp.]
MDIEFIEKEEVINYHFTNVEKSKREVTREKLERALRLGNEFKSKTFLTFQTDQGAKRIETTVWTLTDEFIQIKGGVTIPLKSLMDVQ